MSLFRGFVLLTIIYGCHCQASSEDSDVSRAFRVYGIVPDILTETPKTMAEVTLLSGAKVNLGNELSYKEVEDGIINLYEYPTPTVTWKAKVGTNYTIMMFDADAPDRQHPRYRSFLYWLVINADQGDATSGEDVVYYDNDNAYQTPGGLHRIVILVYEQTQFIDYIKAQDNVYAASSNEDHVYNFSPESLAKDFKLGQLYAGNFYRTSWKGLTMYN